MDSTNPIAIAASLPLVTEEQVVAFLTARHAELRARYPESMSHYVQTFTRQWSGETNPRLSWHFTVTGDNHESIQGQGATIEQAIANLEKECGPSALLAKVEKLRKEASELEATANKLEARSKAAFTVTDETRIIIVETDKVTTWRELVGDNQDGASAEDIEMWRKDLCRRGETKLGGGAAVTFTLKIAA